MGLVAFIGRIVVAAESCYQDPLLGRERIGRQVTLFRERGCGVIVWREQVVQLVMDVAGFTAAQADELRRAFARPNNAHLLEGHWQRFREGAQRRGVPDDAARRIFAKLNGQYMLPEPHSQAFLRTFRWEVAL